MSAEGVCYMVILCGHFCLSTPAILCFFSLSMGGTSMCTKCTFTLFSSTFFSQKSRKKFNSAKLRDIYQHVLNISQNIFSFIKSRYLSSLSRTYFGNIGQWLVVQKQCKGVCIGVPRIQGPVNPGVCTHHRSCPDLQPHQPVSLPLTKQIKLP